jgi:hypothetical protein
MGFHPLHFNGVEVFDLAPATTCASPLMQHPWQVNNGIAREDIAVAIADAEARISQYLRFKLLPTFEIDERKAWPRPHGADMFATGVMNIRGQPSAIKTDWGYLLSGGIQGQSLVSASAPITYTDTDSDGYAETATVTVVTSVTDPDELTVFYPGESGDLAWEIRPIAASITSGVATIRFRREQAVNPGLLEGFGGRSAVGTDDTLFLTAVDVYRMYLDPQQQVQFLWENGGGATACGCSNGGCQICYLGTQFGCASVREYRSGMISAVPAEWDAATSQFVSASSAVGRAPDKVRLWYRAGWLDRTQRRPYVTMDPTWARAVSYMATSLLSRPMCSCQNVTAQVEYWQTDMALIKVSGGASENFQMDRAMLGNPLGTTRGAVAAWRLIRDKAVGEAVLY